MSKEEARQFLNPTRGHPRWIEIDLCCGASLKDNFKAVMQNGWKGLSTSLIRLSPEGGASCIPIADQLGRQIFLGMGEDARAPASRRSGTGRSEAPRPVAGEAASTTADSRVLNSISRLVLPGPSIAIRCRPGTRSRLSSADLQGKLRGRSAHRKA